MESLSQKVIFQKEGPEDAAGSAPEMQLAAQLASGKVIPGSESRKYKKPSDWNMPGLLKDYKKAGTLPQRALSKSFFFQYAKLCLLLLYQDLIPAILFYISIHPTFFFFPLFPIF